MPDQLFKKLCDPATIEIGWHLAHGDSRDDFATDALGYADYAFMKKERFRFIVEQLAYVQELAESKHAVVRWHADFLRTQLSKWVNAG